MGDEDILYLHHEIDTDKMHARMGLIYLKHKVDTCLLLRVEFLNLWNMLEASYQAMVMKGQTQ